MTSVKRESLNSSLPIWILWSLFVVWLLLQGLLVLWWIIMARVGILVMFLILRERLPVEDYIWCRLFIMVFMRLRNIPSIPTLWRVLIKKGCCILSNAFSASVGRIIWFLTLFVDMIYHTDRMQVLSHPCIPGMNPTWSCWIILLMYCWILLARILLRILASILIRDIGL